MKKIDIPFRSKRTLALQLCSIVFISFILLISSFTLPASSFIGTASAQGRVDAYKQEPFTATWNDIIATGQLLVFDNPDTGIVRIPLPFDFPYDGKIVDSGTTVFIPTKGELSLTGVMGDVHLDALAKPAYPGMICFFNGNYIAGHGHGIDTEHYQVDGEKPNRVFTVEMHNLHFSGDGSGGGTGGGANGSGNFIAMQVKLYETTGVIEFIYSEHDSSFLGKIPLPGPPFDTISIGLNGFTDPSFTYNIYGTQLKSLPHTDIRWTPPTSGVTADNTSSTIELGQAYPNPAIGALSLPITLPEDMTIHIELMNSAGVTLRQVFVGRMTSGDHIITIEAAGLPSGEYFCKIAANGQQLVRPIVLER